MSETGKPEFFSLFSVLFWCPGILLTAQVHVEQVVHIWLNLDIFNH
jgi:hypothetical protein